MVKLLSWRRLVEVVRSLWLTSLWAWAFWKANRVASSFPRWGYTVWRSAGLDDDDDDEQAVCRKMCVSKRR